MLGIVDMYNIYIKYYKDKEKAAYEDLSTANQIKEELINFFETNKSILAKMSVTLVGIKAMTDARKLKAISFIGKVDEKKQKIVKMKLKDLVTINKTCNRLTKIFNHYKNITVNFITFKKIIKLYNKSKVKALIEKGVVWNLGNNLGSIVIELKPLTVKLDKNNKPIIRPDWVKSKKRKEELLREGKTLYSKDNPNGVKWLVAFTDEVIPYFNWQGANRKYIANIKDMTFRATKGSNGICTKLAKYRRENPEVDKYYIDKINH